MTTTEQTTEHPTGPHPEARLWRDEIERFDRMLGPFGEAALAACRPAEGERVLDVGCGAGATTVTAAALVGPTGVALGIDVDPPRLELARTRAEDLGLANAEFVTADAATFGDPAGFDVILSRFGMMLFTDPSTAFDTIAGAARPGARLAYVTWTRPEANLWFAIPFRAAGLPLPPAAPGPFALAGADTNAALLRHAGWIDVDVQIVERPTWVGRDLDDALDLLRRFLGPRLDVDGMRPVLDAAGLLLEPYARPAGVELPGVALLCTGRKPHAQGDLR